LLATSSAFAASYSAVSCNPDPDGLSSFVYGHYGAENVSSNRHLIHCGGSKGFNFSNNTLIATVYDRSTWDYLSCAAYLTGSDGNTYYSVSSSTPTSFFSTSPYPMALPLPQYGGYIELECSIPGVDNGQFSYITTYDTP
jgi:hypothetical protein